MVTRVFTLDDQLAFARLSGDWNPVHVDPVAARRTNFGRAVVHGVHLLSWALDVLATETGPYGLGSIRAEFGQAVRVDDEIELKLSRVDDSTWRGRVELAGRRCASFRFGLVPVGPEVALAGAAFPRVAPSSPTIADMADASGTLELAMDAGLYAALFPNLAATDFNRRRLAQLLAITRMVGMDCPGLHSVLGDVTVSFGGVVPSSRLDWEVMSVDMRFSMLTIKVGGPDLSGTVTTMIRPAPVALPPFERLLAAIPAGCFSGARVLMLGGSRGLGAVAALAAARGGAEIRVTWRDGAEDAEQVVAMARALGSEAQALRCDVTEIGAMGALANELGTWRPSHVGLFATPRIEPTGSGGFSAVLFRRYSPFYIQVVADAVAVFAGRGRDLSILYPSTVFLDGNGTQWQEYCAAKAAGEALCRQLAAVLPGLTAITPRLARAATDQSLSLRPVDTQDSLAVIGPVVEEWLRNGCDG